MLNLIEHPLVTDKLTRLRKKETGTAEFSRLIQEIAGLMAYEITRDLPTRNIPIQTPMGSCTSKEIHSQIVLAPILRAALGMAEGIRRLIPESSVGHLGFYRNEETLEPISYYGKFPGKLEKATVLLLDPMLATGGSASAAISELKQAGAAKIKLVCIVGAPEGVSKIEQDHPDAEIFLAALDEGLNDKGYILPGLGDAGDRQFGTGQG